ncbi:FeS cluster assembly protein sufB, partial [Escherichia coli]|nr:FeS cluster assembly protein sufB [Escherichia coli]
MLSEWSLRLNSSDFHASGNDSNLLIVFYVQI